MYSQLTHTEKVLLKESYLEAIKLGPMDVLHAVACAAHDVLVPEAEEWCGSKGQDAFAAALASLVMDKVVKLRGATKRTSTQKMVAQIENYYTYPNPGWWAAKEEKAKKMNLADLVYARKDCLETIDKGMPENEGKYTDEASIYSKFINKKTKGVDVKEVH